MLRVVVISMLLVTATWAYSDESKAYYDALYEGHRLCRVGDFHGARTKYEEALTLESNEHAGATYLPLLSVYRELGDFRGMTTAYERLFGRWDTQSIRDEMAGNFVAFLRMHNALDDAVVKYRKQLEGDPDNLAALAVVATVNQSGKATPETELVRKRYEAACRERAARRAEELEAIAKQKPEHAAGVLSEAAKMWAEAGRTERVKAAVEKSLASTSPQPPWAQFMWRRDLGDALKAIGEPDAAIVQYEEAIKATPNKGRAIELQGEVKKMRARAGIER